MDVLEAINWLNGQPEVASTSGLGVSYGGYLLSVAAGEVPLSLLAIRAPALYWEYDWDRPSSQLIANPNLRSWRESAHSIKESNALDGIARHRGPLLMVWSEHDEHTPLGVMVSYQRAVSANSLVSSLILQGASHVLASEPKALFFAHLREWFQNNHPSNPST